MTETVQVKVVGADGRVLAEARCATPFSIGRGPSAAVRFGHEPGSEDVQVSREHARIQVENGRLTVTDLSQNGTAHGARRLPRGESQPLADRDEIVIQGRRIVLTRLTAPSPPPRPGPPPAPHRPPPAAPPPAPPPAAEPLPSSRGEPVAFTAVPGGKGGRTFGIGPLSLVIEATATGGRLQAVESGDAAAILAALRGAGRDALAVISARAGTGALTVAPEAEGRGLTLNLFDVRLGTYPVGPLDIVTLGPRLRVELIRPGERFLRCQRHSCRRLNPYTPNVNCRFCGTKLIEAVTGFVGV